MGKLWKCGHVAHFSLRTHGFPAQLASCFARDGLHYLQVHDSRKTRDNPVSHGPTNIPSLLHAARTCLQRSSVLFRTRAWVVRQHAAAWVVAKKWNIPSCSLTYMSLGQQMSIYSQNDNSFLTVSIASYICVQWVASYMCTTMHGHKVTCSAEEHFFQTASDGKAAWIVTLEWSYIFLRVQKL